MSLERKHYFALAAIVIIVGVAALAGGGWYWYNSVYQDSERAVRVAHDMADYEFPGEEVGVLSVDLFGWYRNAGTRGEDGGPLLFLSRLPFTSESPEEMRADIFGGMRKEVSATERLEDESWELCGTETPVVHHVGRDVLGDAVDVHSYEACIERSGAIFCAGTVGFGAERADAEHLLRDLECK